MSTFYMTDEDYVLGESIEHWCDSCGRKIVPVDPSDRQGTWQHESEVAADGCDSWDDLESPICQIEFLRAWSDGTWDTHMCEVPPKLFHDKATNDARVEWAERVHGPNFSPSEATSEGQGVVVLWAVYSLGNFD